MGKTRQILFTFLQLFSCNHEADSKIALRASKYRGNVEVVLKETDILILLTYSHSTSAISKEPVVQYDKNSMEVFGKHCQQKYITIL